MNEQDKDASRPDRRRRRLNPWKTGIGTAAVLLAVGWFVPVLPVDENELTVTFAHGDGSVQSEEGPAEALAAGSPVRAGDRVTISEGGSVSFEALDGHEVRLTDSAAILVQGSRRSLLGGRTRTRITVEQGDFHLRGQARAGSSLDVGLPNGVAGVRGTEFNVRVAGTTAAVSVHEGRIVLTKTPGESVELAPGQGSVVSDTGTELRRLPGAPAVRPLPEGAEVVRSAGLRLSWPAVEGAGTYAVTIATDSALQDTRHHAVVDSPSVEIPILDVDEPVLVRVQAITDEGLRGPVSEPLHLEIAYHWADALRLRDEGDVTASFAAFERALERHPENGDLYRDVGWSHYIRGEHEESLAFYRRAQELQPSNTEMLVELARVHFWLESYDEAEVIYQDVLETRPDYADALWGLGDVYRVTGRRAMALELVEQALDQDPDHPYARRTLQELRGAG